VTRYFQPVPETVLDAVGDVLRHLLPLLARAPGPVGDAARHARMRKVLDGLLADTRAAARSDTLAVDIAEIIDGYRASSSDPRAVIEGLERLVTASRGIAITYPTCATLAFQALDEASMCLLFETLGVAAQAEALSSLVPRSWDEATAYRLRFTRSCKLAIERAGDVGQMETARSLREVMGAIARDMIERGRPLARIVRYETALPVPAVALAHLLYQDAARRDELVAENSPEHPAFMPMSGRAYSR